MHAQIFLLRRSAVPHILWVCRLETRGGRGSGKECGHREEEAKTRTGAPLICKEWPLFPAKNVTIGTSQQLPPALRVLSHLVAGRPASLTGYFLGLPGWGSGPLLISNDVSAPPWIPWGLCQKCLPSLPLELTGLAPGRQLREHRPGCPASLGPEPQGNAEGGNPISPPFSGADDRSCLQETGRREPSWPPSRRVGCALLSGEFLKPSASRSQPPASIPASALWGIQLCGVAAGC